MYFPSSFLFNQNPLIRFYVYNSVSLSLWLHLRLDLPRIRGNWEYVFLLPHLAHPCPPLCHARTNLGRRPESVSPHAHRLQCVNSIDHPLMCLFTIALTHAWIIQTHPSRLSGSVLNFTKVPRGQHVLRVGETFQDCTPLSSGLKCAQNLTSNNLNHK